MTVVRRGISFVPFLDTAPSKFPALVRGEISALGMIQDPLLDCRLEKSSSTHVGLAISQLFGRRCLFARIILQMRHCT